MTENYNYKPVLGINVKDKSILHFKSMIDALNKGFDPNCISKCCRGIHKTHKGYLWKYA